MLKTLASMLALSMIFAVGCTRETDPAKTPGSSKTPAPEQTFKLEVPTGSTSIAKGGQEQITIGVDRGEKLTQAVSLSFDPPQGITIEPESPEIAAGASEVQVMVKVSPDAQTGETSIPLTGKSDDKEADGTIEIDVSEQEE